MVAQITQPLHEHMQTTSLSLIKKTSFTKKVLVDDNCNECKDDYSDRQESYIRYAVQYY